jgi:predicted TIM-barrel fold metal-dependent hydrolase
MTDIIDAHVHVWTPDTGKYPLAPGFSKENMKPPSFTPEELFAHCRPQGVKRIVLIQMSFYGFDNSYMLDAMRRFPETFGGVAVVDWNAPRPDDEMGKMAKAGVRGFRVRSGDRPAENWIETEGFERMFRYAADHGLAICPLMNPAGLPSLMRMCAKHQRTRVVIDHLCRIGSDGEIREADVHSLCLMAHFPEVRVKVSAFYALGKKKPPHDDLLPLIRRVYDAFGAKRLMWASDSPFAVVNERYEDSLSPLRDRCPWLKEEDREWIFRKTAEQLFFSPPNT